MESIFTHIILVITVAIINIISANCINKRIAKFNSELKRNEITFSRYNQFQIEALKSIYNKLVDFHYSNSRLLHPNVEIINTKQFGGNIKVWLKSYAELEYTANHERIFMPVCVNCIYDTMIANFEEVKNILIDADNNLFDEMESLYDLRDFDLEAISNYIFEKLDDINNREVFVDFEKDIRRLKEEIENFIKKYERVLSS